MDALEAIYTRRSVRQFTDQPVSDEHIKEILNAGRWAPSGLNNQPWRFVIIKDPNKRASIAELTKYSKVIQSSRVCLAVFIDTDAMYNATKDHQGIGACLQNMLLATHAIGLGAVWLGEILNRASEVRDVLGLQENLELMAVVALGHPASTKHSSSRKDLDDLIIKVI